MCCVSRDLKEMKEQRGCNERGAFQQRNLPEQRPRRGNSSKADWLGHGGER